MAPALFEFGKMRIAVVGTGAVGAYFGGRLNQAGEEVTFIARGENLAALRAHGLGVARIAGDFRLLAGPATDDPAQVGPVDVGLPGVKAGQIAGPPQWRPLLGPPRSCCPCKQNGKPKPGPWFGSARRTKCLLPCTTCCMLCCGRRSLPRPDAARPNAD